MRRGLAIFLGTLLALSAAAQPTKREASAARLDLESTLGSALRRHKTGKLPSERLAKMFLLLARGEENEARRLLLLQGAVVTGVEGGALDVAAEAYRRLGSDIPGMTEEVRGEVLARALRKAKKGAAETVRRQVTQPAEGTETK